MNSQCHHTLEIRHYPDGFSSVCSKCDHLFFTTRPKIPNCEHRPSDLTVEEDCYDIFVYCEGCGVLLGHGSIPFDVSPEIFINESLPQILSQRLGKVIRFPGKLISDPMENNCEWKTAEQWDAINKIESVN